MLRNTSCLSACTLAVMLLLSAMPASADGPIFLGRADAQFIDGLVQPGAFSDIATQTPLRASDRRVALSAIGTQIFGLSKRTVIRPFVTGTYIRHDDFGAFDYLAVTGGAELFSHLTPDNVLRVTGTYTRSFTGRSQDGYAHQGNLLVGLAHHVEDRVVVRTELSGTLVHYDTVAGADGQALEFAVIPQYVFADLPVGLHLRVSAATFNADSDALSHNRISITPSVIWTPSNRWELGLTAGYHSLGFDGPDSVQTTTRDDDVYILTANGRYQLSRDLALRADAAFQDRDSTIFRQDYETRLISLGVDFSF